MDKLPGLATPSDGTNSPSLNRSTVSWLILSSLSTSSYFVPLGKAMFFGGSSDGSTDIRRDTVEEMCSLLEVFTAWKFYQLFFEL